MISFKWSVYGENDKYIDWEASWDGKHDDAWYAIQENCCGPSDMNHPFAKTSEYKEAKDSFDLCSKMYDKPENLREIGNIVANNPITRAYCEVLSNPSKIGEYSGNTDPFCYYQTLLANLSNLWD